MKKLFIFLLVFLVSFNITPLKALSRSKTFPQKQIKKYPKRTLFGIELNHKAENLLKNIEQTYGKKVSEEIITSWPDDKFGQGHVSEDGTPIIRINAKTGKTENNVVHELFHLKLSGEGFPQNVNFSGARELLVQNEEFFRNAGGLLLAPILHYKFFPKMRLIGVNPSYEINLNLNEKIRKNGDNLHSTSEISRTLYYFIVLIESDNKKLVTGITNVYIKNGWIGSVNLAKKLYSELNNLLVETPDDVKDVFQRNLTTLFNNKLKFEFIGWNEEKRGLITQRDIKIKVVLNNN
jgi:hypothetical protein